MIPSWILWIFINIASTICLLVFYSIFSNCCQTFYYPMFCYYNSISNQKWPNNNGYLLHNRIHNGSTKQELSLYLSEGSLQPRGNSSSVSSQCSSFKKMPLDSILRFLDITETLFFFHFLFDSLSCSLTLIYQYFHTLLVLNQDPMPPFPLLRLMFMMFQLVLSLFFLKRWLLLKWFLNPDVLWVSGLSYSQLSVSWLIDLFHT